MRNTLLLLLAALIAGCGSVTSGLDFKAPPGWDASPSLFGTIQVWTKKAANGHTDETVMLIRGRNADNMNLAQVPQVGDHLTIIKRSTITICGNEPAQYAIAKSNGNSGKEILEIVSRPVPGGTSYLSMYIRPQAQPRGDPGAEAAIRSICVKQSPG